MARIISIMIVMALITGCTRINERDEEIAKVQSIVESFYHAIETNDIEQLQSIVSLDSAQNIIPPYATHYILTGEGAFLDDITAFFQKIQKIKIWRKQEHIMLADLGGAAVYTSFNHIELLTPDATENLNTFCTLCVIKQFDGWRIVHIHNSKVGENAPKSKSDNPMEMMNSQPETPSDSTGGSAY